MEGNAPEVCMKVFDDGKQAVYNGVKTTPSLTIVGNEQELPRGQRLHSRLWPQPE